MTIKEIQVTVARYKACSKGSIYAYMSALGVKPIGTRQRPQRYPEDTGLRILMHLGYKPDLGRAGVHTKLPRLKQLRTGRAA